MRVEVGLFAGPPADCLSEGCKDRQVEAPEAPRGPLGKGGVKVVKFLGFQSPEGHSDCEFTVEVEVGRLGAPAGGRRPFLTTVQRF